MTDQRLYCDEPECDNQVAGHGSDKCSTHRRQLSRTGKCVPIAQKVSPKEHLLNLVNRWAEADSDDEYDSAERAVVLQAKKMGIASLTPDDVADLLKQARSDAARRQLAAARARGVRLGRPAVEVDPAEVSRLLNGLGNPASVAFVLKVSRATIYRILKRSTSETASPRSAGGST